MIRLIHWILSLCLAIGAGDALVRLTLEMARSAVDAHQHHQMSYAKFTRSMLNAKLRKPKTEPTKSDR